jgi:hypothetical protein
MPMPINICRSALSALARNSPKLLRITEIGYGIISGVKGGTVESNPKRGVCGQPKYYTMGYDEHNITIIYKRKNGTRQFRRVHRRASLLNFGKSDYDSVEGSSDEDELKQ